MPSDLLLRYGQISEAWWEVTAFKPNTPPMLPLCTHKNLQRAAQLAFEGTGPGPIPAPNFNIQAIIGLLTAALNSHIDWIKVNLREIIRTAVAKALAQFQYANIGQPAAPPPPPPVAASFHHSREHIPDAPIVDNSFQSTSAASTVHQSSGLHDDIYGDNEIMDDNDFVISSNVPDAATSYNPPTLPSSLPVPAIAVSPNRVSDEVLDKLLRLHFCDVPAPVFKSTQQKEAVQLAVEGN